MLKNKSNKSRSANGRFDTLYQQIDMLTNQVVTNETVQTLLQNIMNGEQVGFQQPQSLMKVVNTFQAYSNGIQSFELYTADRDRLFPLDEEDLDARINPSWIEKADQAKGQLIWIGDDLKYPNSFLAIRRVSLMNQWFSGGGYLLVRMERSYLQFLEIEEEIHGDESHILLDSMANSIINSYEGTLRSLPMNTAALLASTKRIFSSLNIHQGSQAGRFLS